MRDDGFNYFTGDSPLAPKLKALSVAELAQLGRVLRVRVFG